MSAHTLIPRKFWQHNGSVKGVSITPIGLLGQPSADTTGVSDMGHMTEANRTRDPISGSVWWYSKAKLRLYYQAPLATFSNTILRPRMRQLGTTLS